MKPMKECSLHIAQKLKNNIVGISRSGYELINHVNTIGNVEPHNYEIDKTMVVENGIWKKLVVSSIKLIHVSL